MSMAARSDADANIHVNTSGVPEANASMDSAAAHAKALGDSGNKASKDLESMGTGLDNIGKKSKNAGKEMGAFGHLLQAGAKFAKLAGTEFIALTGATLGLTLALKAGQLVMKGYHLALTGLAAAAGVAVGAIGSVMAAMREYQNAKLAAEFRASGASMTGPGNAGSLMSGILGGPLSGGFSSKAITVALTDALQQGLKLTPVLTNMMSTLGNFAISSKNPETALGGLTNAFGLAQQQGHLTVQTFDQIKKASPQTAAVFEQIAGGASKVQAQLKAGKLTVDQFMQAFAQGNLSSIKPFIGALDMVNDTLIGRFKKAVAGVKEQLVELGGPIVDHLKAPLSGFASDVRIFLDRVAPQVQAVFAKLFPPDGGSFVDKVMSKFASMINTDLPKIEHLGPKIQEIINKIKDFFGRVSGWLHSTTTAAHAMWENIVKPLGSEAFKTITYALKNFNGVFTNNLDSAAKFSDIIHQAGAFARQVVDAFTELKQILAPIVSVMLSMANAVSLVAGKLGGLGGALGLGAMLLMGGGGKGGGGGDGKAKGLMGGMSMLRFIPGFHMLGRTAMVGSHLVPGGHGHKSSGGSKSGSAGGDASQRTRWSPTGAWTGMMGAYDYGVDAFNNENFAPNENDVAARAKASVARMGGVRADVRGTREWYEFPDVNGINGGRPMTWSAKAIEAGARSQLTNELNAMADTDEAKKMARVAGREQAKEFVKNSAKDFANSAGPMVGGLALTAIGGYFQAHNDPTNKVAQSVSGTISGAGTGAMIGGMIGPEGIIPGMIIGGAIGGLTGFFGAGAAKKREIAQSKSLADTFATSGITMNDVNSIREQIDANKKAANRLSAFGNVEASRHGMETQIRELMQNSDPLKSAAGIRTSLAVLGSQDIFNDFNQGDTNAHLSKLLASGALNSSQALMVQQYLAMTGDQKALHDTFGKRTDVAAQQLLADNPKLEQSIKMYGANIGTLGTVMGITEDASIKLANSLNVDLTKGFINVGDVMKGLGYTADALANRATAAGRLLDALLAPTKASSDVIAADQRYDAAGKNLFEGHLTGSAAKQGANDFLDTFNEQQMNRRINGDLRFATGKSFAQNSQAGLRTAYDQLVSQHADQAALDQFSLMAFGQTGGYNVQGHGRNRQLGGMYGTLTNSYSTLSGAMQYDPAFASSVQAQVQTLGATALTDYNRNKGQDIGALSLKFARQLEGSDTFKKSGLATGGDTERGLAALIAGELSKGGATATDAAIKGAEHMEEWFAKNTSIYKGGAKPVGSVVPRPGGFTGMAASVLNTFNVTVNTQSNSSATAIASTVVDHLTKLSRATAERS